MDDVSATVVGDHCCEILGCRGTCRKVRHHTAQEVIAGDDEPQLLTGAECQADVEHVYFDWDDLAGLELFNTVEAVSGYGVR